VLGGGAAWALAHTTAAVEAIRKMKINPPRLQEALRCKRAKRVLTFYSGLNIGMQDWRIEVT
jgi:hypothetical protein